MMYAISSMLYEVCYMKCAILSPIFISVTTIWNEKSLYKSAYIKEVI